jgi:regulator of replication initiation timing
MSRFEESQLPEMQERLESLERSNWHLQHEVDKIRRTNDVIKEVRVVDLLFDRTKYGKGVEEINRYLERGFEVFKQFQTESGLVIELARWGIKDE